MQSADPPMGKVTKLSPRDRIRRAALAREQPILGARCPKAQARLFDFSVQVRIVGDPFDEAGLQDAAEEVLACVQAELRANASPLEAAAAFELTHSRRWAVYALSCLTGSHAHAKRHELSITNGSPLTVCIGTSAFAPPILGANKLQTVNTHLGDVRIPVCGCFAIVPESTTLGGRWRLWCDACAPNVGKRDRAQLTRHAAAVRSLR